MLIKQNIDHVSVHKGSNLEVGEWPITANSYHYCAIQQHFSVEGYFHKIAGQLEV